MIAHLARRVAISLNYILYGDSWEGSGGGGRKRQLCGSAPLLPPRGKEVGRWILLPFFFLLVFHLVVVYFLLGYQVSSHSLTYERRRISYVLFS